MTSTLKIDLDIKPPEKWLDLWKITRASILADLGIHITDLREKETEKGWHFWIDVDRDLDENTINMLQLLLGDDHTRVRINTWRIQREIPHWNKLFDRKLWRKETKTITCWYCGNKIPIIGFKGGEKE